MKSAGFFADFSRAIIGLIVRLVLDNQTSRALQEFRAKSSRKPFSVILEVLAN
jgi:hypothetical protein